MIDTAVTTKLDRGACDAYFQDDARLRDTSPLGDAVSTAIPEGAEGSGHGATRDPQPATRTSTTAEKSADAPKTPNPDHDELVLLAGLTSTNTQIANYVTRVLDLGRGSIEYTESLAEVERELGKSLLAMGHSVMARVRDPRRSTQQLTDRT